MDRKDCSYCQNPADASEGGGPEVRPIHDRASLPLEIERKFLIRYPDPKLLEPLCSGKADISQTYLHAAAGQTRRIRKSATDEAATWWFTEKEKLSDLTRIERERQITEEEYEALRREAIPDARTIRKTRYYLPSGGHIFEIDLFPEWTDRAFLEIELQSEDEAFEIPAPLYVIREVTQDSRYTNAALAKNGFPYEEIEEDTVL